MAKVRFEGVIVCDDVRREDNGKEILIGVYSGDITLPRLPANIRIFFWAMLYVEEGGEQTFNIRVLGPGEVQLIQGNFHALLPDTPPEGSLPIGPLLLQIQTAGQLSLQIKREGGEWETIKTKSRAENSQALVRAADLACARLGRRVPISPRAVQFSDLGRP